MMQLIAGVRHRDAGQLKPNRIAPARAVKSGYIWINEVSKHFLGAPFGGFKQSGIGREECFEEMLAFTQEKNIHVRLRPASRPAL